MQTHTFSLSRVNTPTWQTGKIIIISPWFSIQVSQRSRNVCELMFIGQQTDAPALTKQAGSWQSNHRSGQWISLLNGLVVLKELAIYIWLASQKQYLVLETVIMTWTASIRQVINQLVRQKCCNLSQRLLPLAVLCLSWNSSQVWLRIDRSKTWFTSRLESRIAKDLNC